ncbi:MULTISPECIES: hypothetical protein [Cysteiniphilum]|uniref:Uncharacterized protein n=1 Tax=Cysteiniphilum litorale TaxID=2056700 RepID=A0A8J2Z5W8_9GAMM|nr:MULTISPECIES: hypothetical protein [Cysteiniphilum]GGG03956.1 hypothetical protein GCM10010995_21800 [Cysteiniphilum litorale]
MRIGYSDYLRLRREYRSQLITRLSNSKDAVIVLYKPRKSVENDNKVKAILDRYNRKGLLDNGYYMNESKSLCIISDPVACNEIFKSMPYIRLSADN